MPSAHHEPLVGLVDDLPALGVLCDLDGSLATIRPRPEDVALVEGARDVLHELAGRVGLLAFVSGRRIDDLVRIVGLPEITYAGNHGMEFRRPGQDPAPAPEAARYRPAVGEFAERWAARLAAHDIELEDKGVTLSLHFRRARDATVAENYLARVVAPAARAQGLVPTPGRKILEIRPPVSLDKGTAARTLLTEARVRRGLFIGDDHTDLDAWRELRAMRDRGLLDEVVTVGVAGDEVPEAVLDGADVVVDGPMGALGALRTLNEGRRAPTRGKPEE